MPGVGNVKDVPSVGGRLVDLMASFARSVPVHQWTWSPSTSCLAYLPPPMAINTFWWPRTISLSGSRPSLCAMLRQRTCMRALYTAFFSRFGLPRQLHSDQGPTFKSKLVAELCSIAGINKIRTSPFTLGLTARPSGRIGPFYRCCVP